MSSFNPMGTSSTFEHSTSSLDPPSPPAFLSDPKFHIKTFIGVYFGSSNPKRFRNIFLFLIAISAVFNVGAVSGAAGVTIWNSHVSASQNSPAQHAPLNTPSSPSASSRARGFQPPPPTASSSSSSSPGTDHCWVCANAPSRSFSWWFGYGSCDCFEGWEGSCCDVESTHTTVDPEGGVIYGGMQWPWNAADLPSCK